MRYETKWLGVVNMALERVFDVADINLLLEKNAVPPYGHRNVAIIMGGVYWGLTPVELSSVTVQDVMESNGEFRKVWVLPSCASFNKEARELHSESHVLPFFDNYVAFRIVKGWGTGNVASYRGLDPNSRFFLNDSGTEYALTKRKSKEGDKDRPVQYQPRSMNEQLKRMLSRTNLVGATPASFRDSFIKAMYESGAGWNDLMKMTGIKQKRTLEKKVHPKVRDVDLVLQGLFSGVKIPKN